MLPPKYDLLETEDQWHIQIKEGELAGLVFKFGEIKFKEDRGEFATLQFEYDVITPIIHQLTKEQVDAIIGSILQAVLEETLEYHDERNNRINDPEAASNQ